MQNTIDPKRSSLACSSTTQVIRLLLILMGFAPASASPMKEAKLWEPVTWKFRNPGCSGNPFDLVAGATFTHSPGVAGFMTNYGSKWGRLGIDRAFVPQYVMYCDPLTLYRNPDRIDADIHTFFVEHGFNGFHLAVVCRWFDLEKLRYNEITSSSPNPDPRTFEVLELLVFYKEDAGSIRMDLSELQRPVQAIAVDTCGRYEEIEISGLRAKPHQTFKAPRRSDWAIAARTIVSNVEAGS